MDTDATTAGMRLARWVSGLSDIDVPPGIRRKAVACVQDTLGVAMAGSLSGPARAARALCCEHDRGPATVLGSAHGHSPRAAALANATAAHALDFDDNCYAGFVHGSAVIVPALLACAQAVRAPGSRTITALVAGAECEYAVGAATLGHLYDQGWWTTGVLGPIGAAMATAHIVGLDLPRTHHALAFAVAMASGTKSCFGSDAKPLMAGRAAETGVLCTLLAAAGASGPGRPFEDPHGFVARFNGGVFDHDALASLGTEWYLSNPGVDVKRIPVCLSSHAAVDAVRELAERHRLSAGDVARVICDVPPIVASNLRYADPRSPAEARFSMQFAVAMTLCDPDWGLSALDPQRLADPALRDLMHRVSMVTGPSWQAPERSTNAPEGASVRLDLHDGRVLRGYRAKAVGNAGEPLSDAQMDRKFLECTGPVIGAERAHAAMTAIHAMDSARPVQALLDALASGH
ncbi:MmgE/PrpD family protein [Bordetella sp. BOR01]|uniref:MmgE/PrpD family protein n=1 Tax=Bordetella sp. BOR01 TaxID=2854779 RepID=UPI001C441B2E|nr:MmgE/PrpD family protein [Bordetella sp. BOR01]